MYITLLGLHARSHDDHIHDSVRNTLARCCEPGSWPIGRTGTGYTGQAGVAARSYLTGLVGILLPRAVDRLEIECSLGQVS